MTQSLHEGVADARHVPRGKPRFGGLFVFLRGSTFFLVMRVVGAGLAFATHMLLARWMGAEQLGYYVAAFSWCIVLARFCTLGFGHSALRFIPAALARGDAGPVHGYVRRARQFVVAGGIALSVVAALIAVAASGADDPSTPAMLVALLSAPLLAWLRAQAGCALALSWPRLSILNVALRPGGLLLGVAIAWVAFGSIGALLVMCIHAAVMVCLIVVQQYFFGRAFAAEVPEAPPQYETRAWVATSLPLMLITLYGNLFFEYCVLFLAPIVPADSLGVFSVAYKLAFLLGFVKWAVDSASLPQLSRLYHQPGGRDRLQEALTSATRLQTFACCLGFLGLLVLGRPLLQFAGPGFEQAHGLTLIIAGSLVIRSALGPTADLLGITGHQKVSLAVCAASLAAAPVLIWVLVPRMDLAGAALAILGVTTASGLWLHRVVSRRLGVHASALGPFSFRNLIRRWGGYADTRVDPRRSVIEVCGPELVRKRCGAYVREEYAKADAAWRAAQRGSFVTPRPLRLDDSAGMIELEYVHFDGKSKDCCIDYLTTADPSNHRMLILAAAAGTVLAEMHEHMDTPPGDEWRPSERFVSDFVGLGFTPGDLTAQPFVPLHGDYCLDNLVYRVEGGTTIPVVLDPSPDFVATAHPLVRGPRYVDLGSFLSCLEGRFGLSRYPRVRWNRVPELKARLIRAYNDRSSKPIDAKLADAFGYCIAREYFRAKFALESFARGAGWLLYNRLKGNLPTRKR